MSRNLIDGIFTFGYLYDELPLSKDFGERGKPAGAVVQKYFEALEPLP